MNNEYIHIFQKYGFSFGRMISASKSGYRERNPGDYGRPEDLPSQGRL